ncbi:MAG: SDR family oxidoreductase [Candidatus Tectomicrobia bacterium]|nr:SDR family oxidoreductase [Candidatus Tectomicrobia bacterium]
MPSVMIVGASRGIGLELARQYTAAGWRVHATTRTPSRPGALGELSGDLTLHELDVRYTDHIAAIADAFASEALDVLIHNAGVSGRSESREEVMRINADAPIRVTQALLEAVKRGTEKKVVLVTSQLGARRGGTRNLGAYGNSKAALNDAFRELAPAWGREGLIAIVLHPGWVRTDMGGAWASLSVEDSVTGIRQLIARLTPAEHGRFWTWDGREHPW